MATVLFLSFITVSPSFKSCRMPFCDDPFVLRVGRSSLSTGIDASALQNHFI